MPRRRLDPAYPGAVVLSTKIGVSDAEKITELATAAGMCRSEYLRCVVLDAIDRDLELAGPAPPEPGG